MNKIDTTDEKTRRHWEDRIARFEGMKSHVVELIGDLGRSYYENRWTKKGIGTAIKCPTYSTSLPDLFRVLRKIVLDGRDQKRSYRLLFVPNGPNGTNSIKLEGYDIGVIVAVGETEEEAIFQAVCQYLRQYHPTVGEEAEDQERGAE